MAFQRTAYFMICLGILLSSCTSPSLSNNPDQISPAPTFQTGVLFQSSSFNDPTEREIAEILEENLTAVLDKDKQKFDDTFVMPKDGEIYYYVMDPPYQRFEKIMGSGKRILEIGLIP
ncbi:hypothetical protein MH117_23720 [Paenibacillus sp. ACRRX]|uniref:hypothetical protein n=1 Tax=Paenibacillus sp. ACRRX TaxID=2918206 RepID=UPI001EF4ED54|nr:hypothetical protein [Paenibacillus sp. ACRRX]MCG7410407.1 hypothetical protein [Paenibacillus sp. ACRRX]